jgi:SPFH domain/Band 7 family protein
MAYVVEKLGRVARVLHPGLHIVAPLVERVASRVPLANQVIDVPTVSNTLRSGGEASASGTVTVRVIDAMRAVTDVADYRMAVATLFGTTWKQAIGDSAYINVLDRVRATKTAVEEATSGWGVALTEMHPVVRLSADAEHMLMAKAEEERESRILAWLTTRGERPGPDGRPTDAQWEAYQEWMDHEVRAHAGEIAEAKRLAQETEQ